MPPDARIRLLFFADTHLGFDFPLKSKKPEHARKRRGQDFFDNYHRVLDFAVESGVDLVIHGGDLFYRSKVPDRIVELAYGPLYEFAERGFPVLIVPGNHERSRLPPSLYLGHPRIHVLTEPSTFAFDINGATVAASGFPFVRGEIRNRFKTILEETGWENHPADVRLLCIHQAVEGAQVGPVNFTFRRGKDVIRLEDLPAGFLAVLSGHIHRQQVLTTDACRDREGMPVIYPGSTERTSFAEKNEEKGFSLITFTAGDNGRWKIAERTFIPLPARSMVDLYIDESLEVTDLENHILSETADLDTNAIVRLRRRGQLRAEVRAKLTSRFLRDLLPDSMIVQFSIDFWK